MRLSSAISLSLLAATLLAPALGAQAAPEPRNSVISIQPLSAMLTVYAVEGEHAVSPTTTLGLGATYFGAGSFGDSFNYTSGDFKVRYYPEAHALQGFSFGGSAGVTHLAASSSDANASGSATGATLGVSLDYSWLLGASKGFFVGLGVGAKTLFINSKDLNGNVTLHYPTARVSIGWAF